MATCVAKTHIAADSQIKIQMRVEAICESAAILLKSTTTRVDRKSDEACEAG